MRPRAAVLTTLLLAGLLGLANAGAPAPEPVTGYASPKAVFDAAVKASKKKDFKAFATLLTPDSQGKLASQLAGLGLMFKAFSAFDKEGKMKDKLADFDKIMDKHGLTKDVMGKLKQTKDTKEIEANNKVIVAAVKDKPAFVGDVMKWLDAANPGKNKGGPLDEAELKDLKVTGDKATGTVVSKVGGKDKEEPMDFAKVGGGWRIVLPEPKTTPAPRDKGKDKDKGRE
jgi:hypothetical protein